MDTELQRQIARVEAMGKTWTISKDGNKKAYNTPNGIEKGLKMMLEGLEMYLHSFKQIHGISISEDFFLAPYFESILRDLNNMLSGEIGRFDGGTLSSTICNLAEKNGLSIE